MKQNPLQQYHAVPSRETAHSEQVACLLAIIANLQAYLLAPTREFEPGKEIPALDGGALSSATATFMQTCKRLDDILADDSRWNLSSHNELYAELVKTQQANQEFIAAQKRAADGLNRPSFQLKPVLVRVDNGYVAIFGDMEVPEM